MSGRVLSLGSILVDVAVHVPALPERGGDVLATGSGMSAAGGFNLAAAAARQGLPCVYAAPHGTGPRGDLVRAALAEEGIALAGPRRTHGDQGICVVMLEPDGERTFVTAPGVEAELTAGDLAELDPTPADVVSVSGYDLLYAGSGPVLAAWVAALPDGIRVALDPGPLVGEIPAERLAAVLGGLAVLSLNRQEARLLTALPGATGEELVHAVRRRAPGALVVVREGPAGCVAGGGPLGDRTLRVPAPRVTAVDTTGAGDTHTGVLLAELVRGSGTGEALTRATDAAADSVTRFGPATAPTRPAPVDRRGERPA